MVISNKKIISSRLSTYMLCIHKSIVNYFEELSRQPKKLLRENPLHTAEM